MCDRDESTIGYFDKHLEQMHGLGQSTDYAAVRSAAVFFEKLEKEYTHEGKTAI